MFVKAESKIHINDTSCSGVSRMCKTGGCSPFQTINVSQISGNTFANLLPAPTIDVGNSENISVLKGSSYDEGLKFEEHFEREINSSLGDGSIKNRDPIFIINLGRRELQHSSYQKWTVVSNPSFAYMRPWWLSVFSLSLLTLQTINLNGTLSPGICPYHFKNTMKEYYEVQRNAGKVLRS